MIITPNNAKDIQAGIFPREIIIWRLLRTPTTPDRDEQIIDHYLQILEAAEALRDFYGTSTAHYVDHELFFPILARRRDPTYARSIVDRLIVLKGENSIRWIEDTWAKALNTSHLPEKLPTPAVQQTYIFQQLLDRALQMLNEWGVRSDALIDAKVALCPKASRWGAGDALVKVFHFILDEAGKSVPRITDLEVAEAMLNEILSTLESSGCYQMNEQRRWHKVK